MEGERLLLEATHKYTAACSEIRRLTTEGAIGKATNPSSTAGGNSRWNKQLYLSVPQMFF